jgi:murein DD-endopeptidase MepM/ murein hydrolase activator NlpD
MRLHRFYSMSVCAVALIAQASGAAAQSRAQKNGVTANKKPAARATVAEKQPQTPRISIEPRQPSGGTLSRLTIDRLGGNADSVVAVAGEMAGEPLRFIPASNGRLQALGAIPLDASDSVVARAVLTRQSGAVDTLRLFLKYPHQAPPAAPSPTAGSRVRLAGARRLRVDPRFTRRMDAETEERVEQENQQAREVGKRAQDTPPLWTLSFLRPRETKVTSRFGSGRVFNGRVSSRHLGVDYRGSLGEPIHAANRGVVALVAEFFLAGNVVYIDHGGGIVTGYFHMSQPEVAVGDTVERGQEIGLVGSTGRVTGPHLHWSARFGALVIDPAGLLALADPFAQPDTSSRKKAASTAQSGSPRR